MIRNLLSSALGGLRLRRDTQTPREGTAGRYPDSDYAEGPQQKRQKTLELHCASTPEDTGGVQEQPVPEYHIPIYTFRKSGTGRFASPEIQSEMMEIAKQKGLIVFTSDTTPPLNLYLTIIQDVFNGRDKAGISVVIVPAAPQASVLAQLITMRTKKSSAVNVSAVAATDISRFSVEPKTFRGHNILVTTIEVIEVLFRDGPVASSLANAIVFLDLPIDLNEEHPISRLRLQYFAGDKGHNTLFLGFTRPKDTSAKYNATVLLLEELVNSRVFGVPPEIRNRVLVAATEPLDAVIIYDRDSGEAVSQPDLCKEIKSIAGHEPLLAAHFAASELLNVDLGSLSSDLFWLHTFPDSSSTQLYHRDPTSPLPPFPSKTLDRISELISSFKLAELDMNPQSSHFNVSYKFAKLIELLKIFQQEGESFRALIFVKNDYVATTLQQMLNIINRADGSFRSNCLTPASYDTMELTVEEFRLGRTNILVTTNIGEDCVDLPRASCVICWDLPESAAAYCHIRAKAHLSGSHILSFAAKGDRRHRRIALALSRLSSSAKQWIKSIDGDIRYLPPSEVLSDDAFQPSVPAKHLNDRVDLQVLREPVTGAVLRLEDCVYALYRCISDVLMLRMGPHTQSFPLLEYDQVPGEQPQWRCTINLPNGLPVGAVVGPPHASRTVARRLAVSQACNELYRLQVLQLKYFPRPVPTEPPTTELIVNETEKAEDNSRSNTAQQYPKRHTQFWYRSRGRPVDRLYPTVVTFTDISKKAGHKSFRSFAILSGLPLPELRAFEITHEGGRAYVTLTRYAELMLSETKYSAIQQYTQEILGRVLRRTLMEDKATGPLLVAPLRKDWALSKPLSERPTTLPSLADAIDKEELVTGAIPLEMPLPEAEVALRSSLVDSLVQQSPRSSLMKVLDIRVDPQTKQLSLELEQVALPPNMLSSTAVLKKKAPHHSAPDLWYKAPFSDSMVTALRALPSIMLRIDQYLVIKELNATLFNNRIDEKGLLKATTSSAAELFFDYERLEFFGDAFLKHLASIYVLTYYPEALEDNLHLARSRLVQNHTLRRSAISSRLQEYVTARPLNLRRWVPSGFSSIKSHVQTEDDEESREVEELTMDVERNSDTENQVGDTYRPWSVQTLSDKAIADFVEAILAAAYFSGGDRLGLQAAKAMGLPLGMVDVWSDFRIHFSILPPSGSDVLSPEILARVTNIVGYQPSQPSWLSQAFIHSSVTNSHQKSYERLEFIGDAVLDFLVVKQIYSSHVKWTPAELTNARSGMVSQYPLAALCVESGLVEFIQCTHDDIVRAIEKYKIDLAQTKEHASGKSDDSLLHSLSGPKILSDVVEAVIGAVLISEGFDIRGAEIMFKALFLPFYERYGLVGETYNGSVDHPRAKLTKLFGQKKCNSYLFDVEDGKDKDGNKLYVGRVIFHDVVVGQAEAKEKSVAAVLAATLALEDHWLQEYQCDCKERRDAAKSQHIERSRKGRRNPTVGDKRRLEEIDSGEELPLEEDE